MEHVRDGNSLVNMIKSRKLNCSGSYEDLVNLLTNYKGTWEEVLDIALILKETHWSTNIYFIREKQFIDTLVKGIISSVEAPTTLSYLDTFLKENSKSREDLLRDLVKEKEEEFTFPATKHTFLISQYAKTVKYVVNKTNYLDFIDNLKKFKKNPKSKEAVINLIILLNCDSGWTDGELEEVLMPFLHKLSKGYAGNLPEFTDLHKSAIKTKKQAMVDIKKALGITIKKSHKELLYELVDSLTDKDFQEGVVDTTVSLEDNILNFSLAAKELNKEVLLQSFCNMFKGSLILSTTPYTYRDYIKGFLYTLCNVGTRRDLVYILDRATLKETVLPTLVKKPEVEPLWMDDGKLNYKYFVDEPFISAADKNAGEGDKPDTKRFVDSLWLLWLYKNTKEQDVNKIKQVLLNLYKELGAASIFRVSERYISNDIHCFIDILTNDKEKNTYGIVTKYFNLYLKAVKPNLLDIPKEVLEHIVYMDSSERVDILSDLRSDSVTKIANAINICVTTLSPDCVYTVRPKEFISSYYSKRLEEGKTSNGYSARLANLVREVTNPKGLRELFKSTAPDSESLHKIGLEDEYNIWLKCEEAEDIAKKAIEENLSKKIEEPVAPAVVTTKLMGYENVPLSSIISLPHTPSVDYVLPYTIEDVNVTKELLSLEGTQSGRVSCGSPNNTTSETFPDYSTISLLASPNTVLPEDCPVEPTEPEKPSENQKRLEDYKHGLYLGVIKESISSLRQIVSNMYLKDKTIIQLLNTSIGDAILSALLAELLPFILGESHKDKIDFIVKLLKENSMFLVGEVSMKFLFGAGKELNRLKENIELMSLLKGTVAV